MSSSLTEAAKVKTDLEPETRNITIKAAAGKGTMRAGRWDPVSDGGIR